MPRFGCFPRPPSATRATPTSKLGYAYAERQLQLAFAHYQRALQLNPRHRGAHETSVRRYMANHLKGGASCP